MSGDCPGSEQLQTVLAMYNQELSRDRVTPSYQRLSKMVRQHVDQSTRKYNFKARHERIEMEVLVKSQEGRNVIVERSGRMLSSGKQLDHVRKETHAVLVTMEHLETGAIIYKKDNRLLLHQNCRHRLRERNHQKVQALEEKVLLEQEARLHAQIFPKEALCECWHPPVCENTKFVSGCKVGDQCLFRQTEADRQTSKKYKKSGGKGLVAVLKESVQLGCVSQDPYPTKSLVRKRGKTGIKSQRQILQGRVAPHNNSGKKGFFARSSSTV